MYGSEGKTWWRHGIIARLKAQIAVDAESGLAHTVTPTAANEANIEQAADLLHGKEEQVWADSGYRGAAKRVQRDEPQWNIAARHCEDTRRQDQDPNPEGRTP